MPDLSIAELPSFGVLIDALVILAITGLWLAWWRNLNRLHKTEILLAESIRQLDQASYQLKQALDHIRALEKQERSGKEKQEAAKPVRKQAALDAEPSDNLVLVRTLHLQRQGKSDEEIAGSLSIPINQVRLMLKMHTTRAN